MGTIVKFHTDLWDSINHLLIPINEWYLWNSLNDLWNSINLLWNSINA